MASSVSSADYPCLRMPGRICVGYRFYNWWMISLYLPAGLHLSDRIPLGSNGPTLEHVFNEMGVRVNDDGTHLVDKEGWRIEFRTSVHPGLMPSREQEQRRRDESRKQAEQDAASRTRVIIYHIRLGK
jgi:hypothetical protein